jgi:hypothetical protein
MHRLTKISTQIIEDALLNLSQLKWKMPIINQLLPCVIRPDPIYIRYPIDTPSICLATHPSIPPHLLIEVFLYLGCSGGASRSELVYYTFKNVLVFL